MKIQYNVLLYRLVDSQRFTVRTAIRCLQAYLKGEQKEGKKLGERFDRYYEDFSRINGLCLSSYPELKRKALLAKDILSDVLKSGRKQDAEMAIRKLELIDAEISKFYKKLGESGTGAI